MKKISAFPVIPQRQNHFRSLLVRLTVPFCILFFLSFTADDFRLLNSVPFSNVAMTTDRLGNAYVIVENLLLQFDSLGKPKGNYAERSSGSLTSVDAGNPLKILLFYRDFARLQVCG